MSDKNLKETMPDPLQIMIEPEFIDNRDYIQEVVLKNSQHRPFKDFQIIRRSIDARSKHPKFRLQIELLDEKHPAASIVSQYQFVCSNKSVIIVGAGPAGYFAALELIEHGIKPIILERGKDVQSRRKDVKQIYRIGSVNPDSNYCFGEGGAGAYSDGKLYTRSTKRGNVHKVLNLLVEHGASEDILIDAHPHIGSNKLPSIVKNIRNTILSFGGEIHFDSRVTDFIIRDGAITGVRVEGKGDVFADAVILAAGHSARDIFELFHRKNILIQAKPFALGVRVEHPQSLIDRIQYHQSPRHNKLPAASYRFACQIGGRGVYSFCMCPGGFIVPTATSPGELVINGMSFSNRNAPYANSGIVVEIRLEDIQAYRSEGSLAALAFQRAVEKGAFDAGGGIGQRAPAQRMTDFVSGKISSTLPKTSYIPGVQSAPLHEILPSCVSVRLKEAFIQFGKKYKGYYTEEAVVLAVESRTSSPVTIPRDKVSSMHPQIRNLFPCGEGAGHAGGIVSSAMDGQQTAKQIADQLKH